MLLPLRFIRTVKLIFGLLLFQLSGTAQNADINLLNKINNADVSSGTYKRLHFITKSTYPVALGVPLLLLGTGLIEGNRTMKVKAVYMLESIVLNELVTIGLKFAINRPRPFTTYSFIIQKTSAGATSSLPSGHTSLAFSMATSLIIAYPRWYVIVPSMAFAGIVGYSRMYLGVHYPSDVFVGALVGSGSALLTYKINAWLHHSKHKQLSVTW
ncbi:MAG: phosphatase PAP2 family protein [Chitinophagaceae bacterium]